ncbi:dihydrodipicolinate synthase family protein [Aliikangiella sp. IMCC44359]|uniref:dihydrodipicolinate synthase family protein n=1 Tax=Aliikangiella sp. IMCC44359 TaxID=3459125 RepID=UPI00403A8BBF
MSLINKNNLQGFVPAVVTPFAANGEIMYDAFEELVLWLVTLGAQGICVAADNGESWTLSVTERAALTQAALKVTQGRIPVFTGATATQNKVTIENAIAATEAGADGLLIMPQTYVLKASQAELTNRFEMISQASDLPIIIYNSPRRVGFSLGLDDLDAILNVANIIGIKESHRDFFHHTHLLEKFSERLSIMIGPCHYIFPGIALGAKGFIATGPELLGTQAGNLTELALGKPGIQQSQLHFKLTRIYEALMSVGTWPASFKAILNLIGQPAGVPRDPTLPLTTAESNRLRVLLDELEIPHSSY